MLFIRSRIFHIAKNYFSTFLLVYLASVLSNQNIWHFDKNN